MCNFNGSILGLERFINVRQNKNEQDVWKDCSDVVDSGVEGFFVLQSSHSVFDVDAGAMRVVELVQLNRGPAVLVRLGIFSQPKFDLRVFLFGPRHPITGLPNAAGSASKTIEVTCA